MPGVHPTNGWETYPESFENHSCNFYGYECRAYSEQLTADSERLFVPNDQLRIKIVEFGRNDQLFDSTESFRGYFELRKTLNPPPVTRLILIPQEFSWGKLLISEEAIRKLLTRHAVFPAFVDIIRTFGQKTKFEDDSYSTCRVQEDKRSKVLEVAYIAKHAEEHGREGPEDSWSMRQMGVYHQLHSGSGNTFIIINPSRSFQRRLKRAKDLGEPPTAWDIHMMLLSSATERWRWYISDLEKRFEIKKTKAQLSGLDGSSSGAGNADIRFEECQEIQVLQDKMLQSSHCLTINRYILQEIQSKQQLLLQHQASSYEYFSQSLIVEVSMGLSRLETILKRVEGTLGLVRGILDVSCLQSLKGNSKIMTELTQLSQDENAILVQLSRKASKDTDTIKFLTLLTLVYLPASLVSSMMGMGYIKVERNNKTVGVHVAGEFWVFFGLTFLFLGTTLGGYYFWVKRKAKTCRSEDLTGHELSRLSW